MCGLFATACPLFATDATTTQELCGGLFRELCRDDTPMVRRAAASNIGPLADAVDARTVQQVCCSTYMFRSHNSSCDALSAARARSVFTTVVLSLYLEHTHHTQSRCCLSTSFRRAYLMRPCMPTCSLYMALLAALQIKH